MNLETTYYRMPRDWLRLKRWSPSCPFLRHVGLAAKDPTSVRKSHGDANGLWSYIDPGAHHCTGTLRAYSSPQCSF